MLPDIHLTFYKLHLTFYKPIKLTRIIYKDGGKQWQANPKNLPRMQRTRAIPVA